MYCLNEQQVDFILNDIRRRGVEMEDLQLNLLDHVCCIVEQNLKEGEDFEAYYAQTIPRFFKHELWEIEQETITLLTFKNYYAMKKAMINSGTISVATFLVGSFFKIMYWPGANVLLLTAIVCFTFLFLPFLFVVKSRETSTWQDKFVIAASVIAGMLYATSCLFAIMHWPFRTPLWISTSVFSLFVLTPAYFFTNIKNEGNRTNTIITTIILIGATGILFLMTSLRPSKAIGLCNFYANQDIVATERFLLEQNESLFKRQKSDSSFAQGKNLHKKTRALYDKVENLKLQIVRVVSGVQEPEEIKNVDYSKLFNDNFAGHVRSTHFLFDDNGEAKLYLTDLKKDVESFDAFIKSSYGINSFGMINTAGSVDVDSDGSLVSWEKFNFYKVPADVILRNLTEIQVEILSVEAVCMK